MYMYHIDSYQTETPHSFSEWAAQKWRFFFVAVRVTSNWMILQDVADVTWMADMEEILQQVL